MRGTTPTHIFDNIGVDLRNARVYLTYSQFGANVLEKTNEDMTITENTISVTLTQEETLAFQEGTISMQIRYVMADGKADKSDIMQTRADKILKEGVITWE